MKFARDTREGVCMYNAMVTRWRNRESSGHFGTPGARDTRVLTRDREEWKEE